MNGAHGIDAAQSAREAAAWVPPLARLGYAAKGVVYLLVGAIAFRAATAAGSPEGARGALQSLAGESGGRLALAAVAIGLVAHVLWRLVQAVLDPEHREHDARRIGMRGSSLSARRSTDRSRSRYGNCRGAGRRTAAMLHGSRDCSNCPPGAGSSSRPASKSSATACTSW